MMTVCRMFQVEFPWQTQCKHWKESMALECCAKRFVAIPSPIRCFVFVPWNIYLHSQLK